VEVVEVVEVVEFVEVDIYVIGWTGADVVGLVVPFFSVSLYAMTLRSYPFVERSPVRTYFFRTVFGLAS